MKKKILVIDDEMIFRRKMKKEFGDQVDCIEVKYKKGSRILPDEISKEESMQNIDNALRNTQYSVILMDGKLGLKLGDDPDGVVVSRKIREGEFGSLNKKTLILNTSDGYENPYTKKFFGKWREPKELEEYF